jgi:hypothetical protein
MYRIFETAILEWRSFDICLNFFDKSAMLMTRKDIRLHYIPLMVDNFKKCNNNIKMHILDILVFVLIKIPDHHTRMKIHHFANVDLAQSKSIFDRKIYIIFCSKVCAKISKKYFKEVFAFAMLKIIEEKKKDIAIVFMQNIIPIRKKLDDISSTSKIENMLNMFKNLFHKETFIQAICQKANNSITSS